MSRFRDTFRSFSALLPSLLRIPRSTPGKTSRVPDTFEKSSVSPKEHFSQFSRFSPKRRLSQGLGGGVGVPGGGAPLYTPLRVHPRYTLGTPLRCRHHSRWPAARCTRTAEVAALRKGPGAQPGSMTAPGNPGGLTVRRAPWTRNRGGHPG